MIDLEKKYPFCMSNCYCGWSYPDSWEDAIVEALDVIEASRSYTVAQIKEKFGGLRIYIDTAGHNGLVVNNPEVNDTVECLWKYVAVEMAIKRAERKVYEIEKARGNKWLNEESN